jgi:hypothetical protein
VRCAIRFWLYWFFAIHHFSVQSNKGIYHRSRSYRMKIIAKHRAMYITTIWCLIFSFACSTAPNVTATFTAKPADTATSTHTPNPTATAQPTFTLTSIPTPTLIADQCAVAPAGLIGWWPGEGNAQDLVAGNDGVLSGGSSFASGKVGQAFSFDGVNGSVNIPRTPSLDVGQQVTVEFWMKPAPGNPMHKCCQGLVGTDYYLVEILDWASSVSGVSIDINTGDYFKHTAEDPNANYQTPVDEWSLIVGTYDGGRLNLYVNGNLEAQVFHQGTIIPMEATSFLSIGSEDGRRTCVGCVRSRYFNGLIDEVSIYNRALTTDEIQSIFLADDAGKCTPSP